MSYYLGAGQAMGPQTLALFDDDSGGLYKAKFGWSYRQRDASNSFYPDFFNTWSNSMGIQDDAAADQFPMRSGSWEPWSDATGGYTRHNFINGQTLNSVGSPVASTVQGFRTSDDLYLGEVGTSSTGFYSFPTIQIGLAHYMVAYLAGSPDTAGTTINTLIPVSTPG